jgi:HSP20 family molecular chaperone IbpA
MTTRSPTDWMWAEACALIDEAERMHRQFFRLTAAERMQPLWEPPADCFEDERNLVIVVALPGVTMERIDIAVESGALVVRAERAVPLVGAHFAVRQLEIPYGRFERRIALPNVRLDAEGTRELRDGCLIVRLRKIL